MYFASVHNTKETAMQTTLKYVTLLFFFSLMSCGPKYMLNGTPSMEYTVSVDKSEFAMNDGVVKLNMGGMELSGNMKSVQKSEERYEKVSEDTLIHTIILDSTLQSMSIMGQDEVQNESNPLAGIPLVMVKEDGGWVYLDKEDLTQEQRIAFEALDEFSKEANDELYPKEPVKVGDSWESSPEMVAAALGGGPGEDGSMTMELKEVKEYKGQTCAVIGFSLVYNMTEDGSELKMVLEGELYRSLELYEDLEFSASGEMSGSLEEGGMITLKGPLTVRYVTEIVK